MDPGPADRPAPRPIAPPAPPRPSPLRDSPQSAPGRPPAVAAPPCLALHGLGGGPFELAPLTDALRAAGGDVAAPTLPGHDGAGPRMPGSTWLEWTEAAEAAHDALSDRAGGAPVAVVGFSTGATLALRLATRRPVARLLLLAPFLAIRFAHLIPFRPDAWLGPIARVVPDLPRRRAAVINRTVRRELAESSRFRTFSLPSTLSALALIEQVKPTLGRLTAPTLILQGRRDSVVEPAGAAWLLDHLGSPEKRLAWFPRSDHLLPWDHDRDAVIAAGLMFLRDGRMTIGGGPLNGPAPDPV